MKLSAWETYLRTQMENKELQAFLHFYNTNLVNDSRRCVSYRSNEYFSDPKDANIIRDARDFYYRNYQDLEKEYGYERLCVLEIPENALKNLVHLHQRFYNGSQNTGYSNVAKTIVEKEWREKDLRDRYPAVQAAWEQYSLMLHLASNGKDLS